MPVRTVKQKDIPKLLSTVIRQADDRLGKMLSGDHQFVFGNRSVQCQPMDALRWFTEMVPESSRTLHIRNIMVNALSDSESIQGASAVVCAAALMELLQVTNQTELKTLHGDLKLISTLSRRCSSQDIIGVASRLDRDQLSSSIARAAILGCSSNASIQVDKSYKTEVRRVSGYKFPVTCPDVFLASSSQSGERQLEDPRVLSIDGIVENMSEIDGVVQGSYVSKTPLIIVARGYSADVQNTLGVNWHHGHLRVVPLIVPFDELGANLLNDISAVTLCDTISTFKGDTISSRKWEDLIGVDKARINFDLGVLVVQNKRSETSVKSQRKRLREARIESTSEIEASVFDRRLSCLMGEGVVITLGDDLKDLRGVYTDRINSHIRLFRAGSRSGVIDVRKASELPVSKKMSRVMARLALISETFPSTTLVAGIKSAISCASNMSKIGGIIYSDTRK